MATPGLLVADFMTIDPIVVNVDASLEEAAHLLRAYSISGLPVIDLDGNLVGVISQIGPPGGRRCLGEPARPRQAERPAGR